MKYFGIFALFISVLLVSSHSAQAATVYNRVPSNRSVHNNNHPHSNSEVKACKPAREEDILNRNRASKMFVTETGRNTRFGKSLYISYRKPLIHPTSYSCTTSNSTRHLRILCTFIFFPFHAFW